MRCICGELKWQELEQIKGMVAISLSSVVIFASMFEYGCCYCICPVGLFNFSFFFQLLLLQWFYLGWTGAKLYLCNVLDNFHPASKGPFQSGYKSGHKTKMALVVCLLMTSGTARIEVVQLSWFSFIRLQLSILSIMLSFWTVCRD